MSTEISEEAIIAALCGKEAPVDPRITFDEIRRIYMVQCDGMYYGSVSYDRVLAAQEAINKRYDVTDEMVQIVSRMRVLRTGAREWLEAVMQHLKERDAA